MAIAKKRVNIRMYKNHGTKVLGSGSPSNNLNEHRTKVLGFRWQSTRSLDFSPMIEGAPTPKSDEKDIRLHLLSFVSIKRYESFQKDKFKEK